MSVLYTARATARATAACGMAHPYPHPYPKGQTQNVERAPPVEVHRGSSKRVEVEARSVRKGDDEHLVIGLGVGLGL